MSSEKVFITVDFYIRRYSF